MVSPWSVALAMGADGVLTASISGASAEEPGAAYAASVGWGDTSAPVRIAICGGPGGTCCQQFSLMERRSRMMTCGPSHSWEAVYDTT